MATVTEEIKKLRSSSEESIDSGKPIDVPTMSVGDMIPQGDIGLLKIGKISSGAKDITEEMFANGDCQLAPGTSKGSRHTIPSRFKEAVKIYRVNSSDPLSDLEIEAKGTFDLKHPEHADHIGYAADCYQVRHQQNSQHQRVID